MAHKHDIVKELEETWFQLLLHPWLWVLGSIVDLTYYVLFSFSLIKFYETISDDLQAVYTKFGTQVSKLSDMSQEAVQKTLQNQDQLLIHYYEIAYYAVLTGLTIFMLWLLFQGANWYIAHMINDHKLKLKRYIVHFTTTTVLGAILAAAIMFISVQLSISLVKSPLPLFGTDVINWMSLILFLGVFYLLFASYSLMHKTKLGDHHKHIKKQGHVKICSFIVSLVLIILANLVMWKLLFLNAVASLIWGVIIVLPLYTFCRVYVMRMMKK